MSSIAVPGPQLYQIRHPFMMGYLIEPIYSVTILSSGLQFSALDLVHNPEIQARLISMGYFKEEEHMEDENIKNYGNIPRTAQKSMAIRV